MGELVCQFKGTAMAQANDQVDHYYGLHQVALHGMQLSSVVLFSLLLENIFSNQPY